MPGMGNARGNLNNGYLGEFPTIAAAEYYANAFGYLRNSVYFWDTTQHAYAVYENGSWNYGGVIVIAALGPALVTVLPAGSVAHFLEYGGNMVHSGGVGRAPSGYIALGGSQTIDFGGGNIITIAVTAGGAVTLQLTAGAGTVSVKLRLNAI